MTGLLVSIANRAEAEIAIKAGVDILDMKNPAQGALGRLTTDAIVEIASLCRGKCISSATIGDLPMHPQLLANEALKVADAGVDIVKIGFFGTDQFELCTAAISEAIQGRAKLIAVMMADHSADSSMIAKLKVAGFYGVMLDTAIKNGKTLLHHMHTAELIEFCRLARQNELVVGLAGSLDSSHIQDLVNLAPDYLGFRGAVCHQSNRIADLKEEKVYFIKEVLYLCNSLSRHKSYVGNITYSVHCK